MSASPRISERELAIRRELMESFPKYAEKCLFIRPKAGEISRLALNKAQLYLHDIADQQLKDIGKVRILILKGRQQGISMQVASDDLCYKFDSQEWAKFCR